MKKLGKNYWTVSGNLEDLKVVAVGNEKMRDRNKRMHKLLNKLGLDEEEKKKPPVEIEFEEVSPAIVEVISTPKQIDPVALVALESRMPEIEAACRDFLALGNLEDSADVNSFIESLSSQGFNVEDVNLRDGVTQVLQALSTRAQEEDVAMHSGPNSWREREELRRFEDSRQILREALSGILHAPRMTIDDLQSGVFIPFIRSTSRALSYSQRD